MDDAIFRPGRLAMILGTTAFLIALPLGLDFDSDTGLVTVKASLARANSNGGDDDGGGGGGDDGDDGDDAAVTTTRARMTTGRVMPPAATMARPTAAATRAA